MRAAIALFPFKFLTRTLRHSSGEIATATLPVERLEKVKAIKWAIGAAAKHTPWESACLAQAFTARRMLQKRGIPGVFNLGVMRGGRTDAKMKAHAWAKSGEVVVTGSGFEGFAVLSSFAWNGL